MAESNTNASMKAALDSQRQEEIDQQTLSLLSTDLERLLADFKGELDNINFELATKEMTVEQLNEELIHIESRRNSISRMRSEFGELSGTDVPDCTRITFGDVEYSAVHTIANIKNRVAEVPSITTLPSGSVVQQQTTFEPEVAITIPSDNTTSNIKGLSYGARLEAAAPNTSKSKTKSKASKKTSTKRTSSTGGLSRTQLLSDRAKIEINERFDLEQDARTRRHIKRDRTREEEARMETAREKKRPEWKQLEEKKRPEWK